MVFGFCIVTVMSSVAVPAPFPIDETYGPYFISSLICIALWGMLCMQTFWYFAHYENDDKWLKFLVAFLWIIDTAQTYLIVAGAYVYLIEQFGNWTFFFEIVSPFWVQIILGTIAETIVQGFFVHRLYTFSEEKLWIVPALWFPTALYGFIAAFVYVFRSITAKQANVVVQPVMRGLGVSYLAVSAVIDVFIAIGLTVLLLKQKKYTQTRSTVKMMQRLIIFSIVSGTWTAVFAVCDIATYLGIQDTSIWVVFDMPICSLYCNTLLANLNGRTYIAGKNTITSNGINLSTFHANGDAVPHEDSDDPVLEVDRSSVI